MDGSCLHPTSPRRADTPPQEWIISETEPPNLNPKVGSSDLSSARAVDRGRTIGPPSSKSAKMPAPAMLPRSHVARCAWRDGTMTIPRVAALVTTYFRGSHADVLVTKILEGYDLFGERTDARIRLASLYLEQVDDADIGVGLAHQHGVPLFGSIRDALTLGGSGGRRRRPAGRRAWRLRRRRVRPAARTRADASSRRRSR